MCQPSNPCQYVHLSCQIVHSLPICPLKFAHVNYFLYLCAKFDANSDMTEREKMLSGEVYDACDADLLKDLSRIKLFM